MFRFCVVSVWYAVCGRVGDFDLWLLPVASGTLDCWFSRLRAGIRLLVWVSGWFGEGLRGFCGLLDGVGVFGWVVGQCLYGWIVGDFGFCGVGLDWCSDVAGLLVWGCLRLLVLGGFWFLMVTVGGYGVFDL